MGADGEESWLDNSPGHGVALPDYFMARWPVTADQFCAFVDAAGYGAANSDLPKGLGNHPVVWVSWQDALAYCRWLQERLISLAQERLAERAGLSATHLAFWTGLADGRLGVGLPSEPEWEKAARGSDGRAYPWGQAPDLERANYFDEGGIGTTSAVGCFPAGASPYGCQDMTGNVWEWTRSRIGGYPYPQQDPERRKREDLVASNRRVLRGGSFLVDPGSCRCAFRFGLVPDLRLDYIGFRVVVSPFL